MNKNNQTKSWSVLWQLTSGQRGQLLCSLLFTALAAMTEMVPYWIVFQAIEVLLTTPEIAEERLIQLALWLTLALLLKTCFYAIAYTFSHKAAYAILVVTRKTLVTHLASASLNWLQSQHSGQLKQSILQDIEKVENVIAHHSVEVFAAILSPIIVTFYLFLIDWRLAIAALVTAPLAITASALLMRNSSDQYDQYSSASAALENTTVEYLRNLPVMKVFRQDVRNFHAMRQQLTRYHELIINLTKKTVLSWTVFTSLLGANILFILPVGSLLYTSGDVSKTTILMAVVLGSGMLKPLLKISRFFMEINEVLSGLRRLIPIFQINTQQNDNKVEMNSPLAVSFEHVCFTYPNKKVPTLQNIELHLAASSFNVVLGPSGAGKSTIAHLLGGLLLPGSGEIYFNNRSLQSMDQAQRSACLAMVTQDVFLFHMSIKDNIKFARPDATNHEILAAIKVAQAASFISALPEGYHTLVGEQGVSLSGGEKQRIAIARALLANTPILILDEASAALDNITQKAFYLAVKASYPSKTVLIITHRSAGLENADKILVIDKGMIDDQGTHQDLLSRNLFYQKLWRRQTECDTWAIGSNN